MNNIQKSEDASRREPGARQSFFQRLLSPRRLRRRLFAAACLGTLIALFYAVENWRGRRAWDNCRRALEAKGEVIDWNAFIPGSVPDDQNIFKAPKMAEWFVKQSWTGALTGNLSQSGNAEVPFSVTPRPNDRGGAVTVAEVQFVLPTEPLGPGQPDAVLRWDDPSASEQAARLIRTRVGPCVEGPQSCVIVARAVDALKPVYLVMQADKVPTAQALAEFLPRNPVPRQDYNPLWIKYFKVDAAGNKGFLVSLQPPIYTASEYLELSQPAVPDLDVLRKAIERPYARMDSDYQRPFEHPVPNFVRLRTVAQLLAQRAQCYLLLGQPEAAWRELGLVRNLCRMLEAKPASDCPTLVEAMIDVAIGGLYISIIQEGLRLNAWREPELAAMQKQLGQVNFPPLVHRSLQAERAATCRTFEVSTPAELRRLFRSGREKETFWDRFQSPTFLFLSVAPRGWFYQNMCTGTRLEQSLFESFDLPNNQLLPGKLRDFNPQAKALVDRPYSFLAVLALPNFVKATQTTARNQTLANEAFIACGLERYRLAHGEYPKSLDALVPQFAPQLPRDLVGGAPLRYERIGSDRFELYSIGWNGKDDGGIVGKTVADGDWVWQ